MYALYKSTFYLLTTYLLTSVTWPFDSQVSTSCRHSIVTKSPSPAIFEIMGSNILGSWPWPFRVTWRHRSRDHLIPRYQLHIGAPLSPGLYLQPFPRYWALSILGSWPCPFRVTWRHRSRDHWTRGWVISCWWSFGPKSLSLTVSEIFRRKDHVLMHNAK